MFGTFSVEYVASLGVESYVLLSVLNMLNSLILILRAGKKDMYCPALSVESVEFPYFAFKSRKKKDMYRQTVLNLLKMPFEGRKKKTCIAAVR